MNKYIIKAVEDKYGFNPLKAEKAQLNLVEEIIASDVTGLYDDVDWDFTSFPNLKKIDCSFNCIKTIDVSMNTNLEEFRWEGVRGSLKNIDLSKNIHLKKIVAGQDGLVELDLSNNVELEEISIWLNRYMRWINLDKCINLKKITMTGVNIPFVDLRECNKLEFVDINYLNLYARKYDEYGPGYPRPFIFVKPDFNELIIKEETRRHKSYTYYLVRTGRGTKEEEILNRLKANKDDITSIYADRYGECVADEHYRIRELLEEVENNNKNTSYNSFDISDDELPF